MPTSPTKIVRFLTFALVVGASQPSLGSELVIGRYSLTDPKSAFRAHEEDAVRQVPLLLAVFSKSIAYINPANNKTILTNFDGAVTSVIGWSGEVRDRFNFSPTSVLATTKDGVWVHHRHSFFRFISNSGYEVASSESWPLEPGRLSSNKRTLEFVDAVIELPIELAYWQRQGLRLAGFNNDCLCVRWFELVPMPKQSKPRYFLRTIGEWKLPERKTQFTRTSDPVTGGKTLIIHGPQEPQFTQSLDLIYAAEEKEVLVVRKISAP